MLEAKAIGRLVADPTLRTVTKNGTNYNVCEFRLACQQRKDKVDFINNTAWRGMGDFIFKSCHKGQKVFVEGTLTIPPFSKEKGRAYDPYICVSKFEFCDSKPKNERPAAQGPASPESVESYDMLNSTDEIEE